MDPAPPGRGRSRKHPLPECLSGASMDRTMLDVHAVIRDLIIRGSDELVDLLPEVLPLGRGRGGRETQPTWERVAEMARQEGLLSGEEARLFLAEVLRYTP